LGAPGRQINSIELGSALTPHSSGIQLLAAADLTDASESISETTLSGIFDVMRQLFDYVIIDCGGRIDARVVQTWDRSDQLLYVLDQSINGIRCAWRFQQLCDQVKFAAAKPRFVINRFDPTHPASNQQISNALGAEIFARIPADARAMQRREARGRDLWHTSPGSPLVTAYEEIADAIISGKTSANYHTPVAVIPRLLAAIGARQTENGVHVS
jgi:Flp pilus assembly CpaE family ATPase